MSEKRRVVVGSSVRVGSVGLLCAECGERKPKSSFAENKRLDGGYLPWCDGCLDVFRETPKGPERKKLSARWRKAYQLLYHRRIRALEGSRMRPKLFGRTRAGQEVRATYLQRTGRARISGPWSTVAEARDIMLGTFGADPATVSERGTGAGTGRRRQRRFEIEGAVTEEDWERGIKVLAKAWDLRAVRRFGR